MRRVVVTGIGAVTPLGNTFGKSWQSLKAGGSGIKPVDTTVKGQWRKAGIIKGFDASLYLSSKEIKRLDLFIQYAVASALMAVEDAGSKAGELVRAGVIIGSSRGGVKMLEESIKKEVPSAYLMSSTTIGMAGSYTAQKLSIRGYSLGISNSCSSGANAIGEAYRLIKEGMLKTVLAGASEAPICRVFLEGYGMAGALSKRNIIAPFDKKRDGFVLAEGGTVLVLEDYSSALKRGARVYAEVIGYGNTVDAFHETRPLPQGQASAIKKAILTAGLKPQDIQFINAHATATSLGDRVEVEAIRLVFGEHAKKIPITANKSMTGHMLSVSGAFEAASTVMSIFEGVIPPTINLKEPEFELDFVTKQRKAHINIAISNSFGFGGVNAVLVFRGL